MEKHLYTHSKTLHTVWSQDNFYPEFTHFQVCIKYPLEKISLVFFQIPNFQDTRYIFEISIIWNNYPKLSKIWGLSKNMVWRVYNFKISLIQQLRRWLLSECRKASNISALTGRANFTFSLSISLLDTQTIIDLYFIFLITWWPFHLIWSIR